VRCYGNIAAGYTNLHYGHEPGVKFFALCRAAGLGSWRKGRAVIMNHSRRHIFPCAGSDPVTTSSTLDHPIIVLAHLSISPHPLWQGQTLANSRSGFVNKPRGFF
jgi:hypothetical protein